MSTYTQPFFSLLMLVTVIGILVRRKGLRSRFVKICAICLFLFCWRPTAWLALRALENGYSPNVPPASGVQAIVVLSSEVLPPSPPRDEPILAEDTYERCWYAAWLYGHWSALPVLASGGARPESPYSVVMRQSMIKQ